MKYVFWVLSVVTLLVPLQYREYATNCTLISFICMVIPELKGEKLLIAIWLLYWTICDALYDVSIEQYAIEVLVFSMWLLWAVKSKFINYLPYNKDNICIAFYRGENHSLKARLSSLIGLDVTSVAIYNKGEIHRYKKGKLITSKAVDEYIMYDTGKPITKAQSKTLLHITKTKYHKKLYTSNCVGILKPLMVELRIEPHGYLETIPSIYLRRLLKNARR